MDEVRSRLLTDERIIWEGKPDTGLLFRPVEVVLIPFSLFWAGFAIFWNASVWTAPADLPFKLFGIPFLIAAFYVTVGRFLLDMQMRKATTYFVTNRRAIVARRWCWVTFKSVDLKRLPALEFDERPDGSGTIRFGSPISYFRGLNGSGIWQPTLDVRPQFIRIPDARSVYELIQKL